MGDEFSEAPGPLALFRRIPVAVRWWVYSGAATLFAIEGVLDLAEVGLIPGRAQGIIMSVLGLFGFTMASVNTKG